MKNLTRLGLVLGLVALGGVRSAQAQGAAPSAAVIAKGDSIFHTTGMCYACHGQKAEGVVGPIGGIQQKIAGARDAGVQLFLVPSENCADALGAENGDMRLVRAESFDQALTSVEKWVEDHDAELPSCEDVK